MKDLQKSINITKQLLEKQTDLEKKAILEDYEALLVKAKGVSSSVTSTSPLNSSMVGVA